MRRPINPVIPYPHEAIQHTRCVLALSMITVALSLLKPEMLAQLGDLGKQVEKVNRWIERCSAVSYTHLDVYKRQGDSFIKESVELCSHAASSCSAFLCVLRISRTAERTRTAPPPTPIGKANALSAS